MTSEDFDLFYSFNAMGLFTSSCTLFTTTTFAFVFFSLATFAQDLSQDSISIEKQKLLLSRSTHNIDSIQQAFHHQTDSLTQQYRQKFYKVDSTRSALEKKLDGIKYIEQIPNRKLENLKSTIARRTDSLSIALQHSRIQQKLDSINDVKDSLTTKLNQGIQTIKDKTVGKVKSLQLPAELSSKVSDITSRIENYNVPLSRFKLPAGGIQTPSISGSDFNTPLPSLPGVNSSNLGSIPGVNNLPNITSQAGDQVAEMKQLTGDLGNPAELSKTAETKAAEMSGLNDMTKQTSTLDQYKETADGFQDPDSIKSFAIQEVRQAAVNHFAGREQELTQAMEVVSKVKKKYSDAVNIKELPKRPRNTMKGKPFGERLLPGIAMQVLQKGDNFMVDFNPYIGYRVGGRITTGLGWNQRLAYNRDRNYLSKEAMIYGPRIFAEAKVWRGFSPRLEGELMNTIVPPKTSIQPADPHHRDWVYGAFFGLKKEYRFLRNVKGTALIMMRLVNPQNRSLYSSVVNVRFGFEFPIRVRTVSLE